MSKSILERLNSRIAAEPALDHLETLFVDLQDARDAIIAAEQLHKQWTAVEAQRAAQAAEAQEAEKAHKSAATASHVEVIEHLQHAKERLSVNALSTVGDNIERAIQLLG
jgi:uncharacterized protein with von Willebrand factor type A (vWA) domain